MTSSSCALCHTAKAVCIVKLTRLSFMLRLRIGYHASRPCALLKMWVDNHHFVIFCALFCNSLILACRCREGRWWQAGNRGRFEGVLSWRQLPNIDGKTQSVFDTSLSRRYVFMFIYLIFFIVYFKVRRCIFVHAGVYEYSSIHILWECSCSYVRKVVTRCKLASCSFSSTHHRLFLSLVLQHGTI